MNQTQTYRVRGMHCASCASIIEKSLRKIEGVDSIEVNSGTEKAKISFDESKTNVQKLSKIIEPLGYSIVLGENHSKHSGTSDLADMKWKVISAIPLAMVSAFVMSWEILGQFGIVPAMLLVREEFFHHLLPLMATYV